MPLRGRKTDIRLIPNPQDTSRLHQIFDVPPLLPGDYYSYSTPYLHTRLGCLDPTDSYAVRGKLEMDCPPDDGDMTPFDVLSSVFREMVSPAMLNLAFTRVDMSLTLLCH